MSDLIPAIESFAKGAFATAAGLSTIGVGLLWYGQNYLIYPASFPEGSRTNVPVPTQYDLPYEDLTLVTQDRVKIRCYLLVQRKELNLATKTTFDILPEAEDPPEKYAATRPTIIMFHGNGGNMGHRIPLAKIFYLKMRCNVMMVSYRGYGLSEGSPSEEGFQIDAQTALEYLLDHEVFAKTPIILYGQSIGGAVSIDLASRNPETIRALILENTFMTLPSLIPSALPFLSPFAFLCHQKWESAKKLPKIPVTTPILMLSGLQDEVVPAEHMKELWEIAKTRRNTGSRAFFKKETEREYKEVNDGTGKSKFVEFPEGHHNDTFIQAGYWSAVETFVAGLESS
ncbi:Alpha/Beta hydrolase protein [Thelephora terrestris]|uniref:Alpha/Beta hydrolase protein n=1 Tax=Thelephora terrestris TaxID=56493 RepID=A0A9P6L8Z9_9AGAM|nr:Alpha/Beta hydrolase protein [Thelephora terrestris]